MLSVIAPCRVKTARRNAFYRNVQRGFTLLELMVVVAIIGILFSFAALSISTSGNQNIEEEAKRIAALVRLASEEAIINTREILMEVDKRSYKFLVLTEQGPVPIEEGDKVFRPRELPENLEIKLVLEDQTIEFDSVEVDDLPRIYILSSGEMSPFTLTILREDGLAYGLEADFFGKVEYLGKIREGF